MNRYVIRSRESGIEICTWDNLEDAITCISNFEISDSKEGIWSPDFYEIYDTYEEKIVFP